MTKTQADPLKRKKNQEYILGKSRRIPGGGDRLLDMVAKHSVRLGDGNSVEGDEPAIEGQRFGICRVLLPAARELEHVVEVP